eukprot:TRINITY_DN16121_c0_g1_i1.p1 TRINITY_DN16121_c0_g1~~TRINITY_DN16121_c0_g1_i1.p1  ORF type:complete len:394 (+),score=100.24 TRINITY_DN16121_c0_g1_i1:122-1303(+)
MAAASAAGPEDMERAGERADGNKQAEAEFWERIAVGASFWLGGVGLALLKAAAYFVSGSALVRAAMFESLGDVVSSAIMAITQAHVNDHRNAHHYPLGKTRLVPLGVLFFCAFMMSGMIGMGICALQAICSPFEEAGESGEAEMALRRLFQAKPRLSWVYGPGSVEALVREFRTAPVDEPVAEIDRLSVYLLGACLSVKAILYCFCRNVESLRGSEIVRTLRCDHRNDALASFCVICVMVFVATAARREDPSPYLEKVDPAASLLLACWICYGWAGTAMEQLEVLADRRAPAEQAERIGQAARRALTLQGVPLHLHGADVYFAGEGIRVRLDLTPLKSEAEETSIDKAAAALEAVEKEVRCVEDVVEVDTQLRPRGFFCARRAENYSWVAEYA